ncbi:MAG: hypothetical protein KDK99_19555 [Verrucomicrobiales bacterium]|nr:hypothetical protein [Verrucomicrobiales bacterium]
MKTLPDAFFENAPEYGDFGTIYQYIHWHLDRANELGLSIGWPESVLALARLPKVDEYFEEDVFWTLSDQALADNLERAERDARQAAAAKAAELKNAGLPPDQLEAEINKASQEVISQQKEHNGKLRSYRNGLLYILRATGHPEEGAEVENLWQNQHGNEALLGALRNRIYSRAFDIATHDFVKQHKDDLQRLSKLTDRSGPEKPNLVSPRRPFPIRTVAFTSDGESPHATMLHPPFEATYRSHWELSHPCACTVRNSVRLTFSRASQRNWHPINKLFDKFYTREALETIASYFPSVKLFKSEKAPFTFLTEADFNNAQAPVYAIPQIFLNYYYCNACGSEYLCRYAEGLPMEPCREAPAGRPGKLIVHEITQFHSAHGSSFLNYMDSQRTTSA